MAPFTTPSWSSAKCFQILVVCSNNAERLLLVETFQHCFGYRSANLGFRTATELVDKDETAFVAVFHHYLHIGQVRGVGAEVIFDRLLVADVNEYIAEYAGMATFVHRDEQTALQHILQQPYGFQADRLSAGVGTGDDENTLFFVQLYIQRYNFFPCLARESCNSGCTAIVQSITCLFSKAGFSPVICSENKALARMKSISARNSYDSKTSGMDGRNKLENSIRMRIISAVRPLRVRGCDCWLPLLRRVR